MVALRSALSQRDTEVEQLRARVHSMERAALQQDAEIGALAAAVDGKTAENSRLQGTLEGLQKSLGDALGRKEEAHGANMVISGERDAAVRQLALARVTISEQAEKLQKAVGSRAQLEAEKTELVAQCDKQLADLGCEVQHHRSRGHRAWLQLKESNGALVEAGLSIPKLGPESGDADVDGAAVADSDGDDKDGRDGPSSPGEGSSKSSHSLGAAGSGQSGDGISDDAGPDTDLSHEVTPERSSAAPINGVVELDATTMAAVVDRVVAHLLSSGCVVADQRGGAAASLLPGTSVPAGPPRSPRFGRPSVPLGGGSAGNACRRADGPGVDGGGGNGGAGVGVRTR